MTPRSPRLAVSFSIIVVALIGLLAQPVDAQERPGPVGEFAAGALLFADDGVVSEGFVGGTARLYVLPRVSVGPESRSSKARITAI